MIDLERVVREAGTHYYRNHPTPPSYLPGGLDMAIARAVALAVLREGRAVYAASNDDCDHWSEGHPNRRYCSDCRVYRVRKWLDTRIKALEEKS